MCLKEGSFRVLTKAGSHGKMSLWLSRSLFLTVFLCICLFREESRERRQREERETRERREREEGEREREREREREMEGEGGGRRRMNERTIKKRKICNNINLQADMYSSEYDI